MTDHNDTSYILFNKTLDECRRLGARGGRAQARNRRLRQLDQPPEEQMADESAPQETTAEAIALLDAQFPWLRGAEKRRHSGAPQGGDAALVTIGQQNSQASLCASL